MRRAYGFLVAVFLVVAGVFWFINILVSAKVVYGLVVMAPLTMITTGCIWLYVDYVDPAGPFSQAL